MKNLLKTQNSHLKNLKMLLNLSREIKLVESMVLVVILLLIPTMKLNTLSFMYLNAPSGMGSSLTLLK